MTAETETRIVDFTRSIPPVPEILPLRLGEALRACAERADLDSVLRNALAGGSPADRQAGAAWLLPRFRHALEAERVVLTNGTQSALLMLFARLVGRDGLLLAESLSYGVLAQLARNAQIRLKGLAIDAEGIIPEAFEEACRRERPCALYCNPTVHNPTTVIMPESRRRAIVAIARRHGVAIIEDDALGRLHSAAPPPIAALAPDLVWYVMGLTKCLAHGLRIAYLVGPSAKAIEQMAAPFIRLSHWYPSPLATAVVGAWMESGVAEEICAAIRSESEAREALARGILGPRVVSKPGSMHVWLPLPSSVDRHSLTAALKRQGVLVRPAELFSVDDAPPPNAVRLSLSSPATRAEVESGLHKVDGCLEQQAIDLDCAKG